MAEEPIDQDHPAVQEVQQAVVNHGWMMMPADAIDLVQQTKEALARYDQKAVQQPATQPAQVQTPPNERQHEVAGTVRELLPDYVHTPEGDKPEIPDDLIEEVSAILADHHTQ